jgi:hypothetical protein
MKATCDYPRRCNASWGYDDADRARSFRSPESATATTYDYDHVDDGQNVVMQFQAATNKLAASPFRLLGESLKYPIVNIGPVPFVLPGSFRQQHRPRTR